jgi:hypothetical protein
MKVYKVLVTFAVTLGIYGGRETSVSNTLIISMTFELFTDENVCQLDIPMQDGQSRHMHERL